MRARQVLLVALTACAVDPYAGDSDRDGVADYDDCAPTDPQRFPGNVEVCDGVDNDCDRQVDEELDAPWYVDADGDGHGDPRTALGACTPQDGRVQVGDDCDDADPTTHPGAVEVCDGADNDCQRGPDDAWWQEDFEGDEGAGPSSLLSGEATVVEDDAGGHALRLTRAAADQASGLWLRTPVPGGAWRLAARVRVRAVGQDPGEGLAFVFAGSTEVPIVGSIGPGLGVYGADTTGLAFELDLARSGDRDTTGTGSHLGLVDLATTTTRTDQPRSAPFDDGEWHLVEYEQVDTTFEVRVDNRPVWFGDVRLAGPPVMVVGLSATTSRNRLAEFSVDDVSLSCGKLDPDTGVR